MIVIVSFLFYFIGYLVGKLCLEKQVNIIQQSATASEIKAARISMVIRSYRNELYRKETELKMSARNKQDLKSFDYLDIKSKLEIVRKIEEDVANEMQEI